jgi:K+ transporter
MTPERRKLVTLSSLILCVMIVCAVFSFRHSPHESAFSLAFFGLLIIHSFLLYRHNLRFRQPDTLTHLFPVLPENQGKL